MLRSRLDRAFVRYTRTGDPAALARVFDGCAAELYRLGWHLLGDRHAAEDLVQQTFVVAIEQRATFASEHSRGGVLGWLCGILTNRALHVRRMMRQRAAKVGPATDVVVDAVAEVAARELSSTVATAVRGLPEPYRQVLLLHLVHELTPQEVAEALARPGATVRTQLARGLAMLRKVLPVGLAGVAMGAVPAPLGLGAVRAAVLQRAGEGVVVSTAGAAIGTFVGVLVMKKLLAVIVVLLAVLWSWSWWTNDLAVPPAVQSTNAASPVTIERVLLADGEAAPNPLQREAVAVPAAVRAGLEVAVRWHDGSPAASVAVRCRPLPLDTEPWLRTVRTDERGIAWFAELWPGKVQVLADRGGAAVEVELATGGAARAEITIPRGQDVRGRVVDVDERPVAGASVWMSVAPNSDDGEPVATSGADGTFAIRSAGEWYSVTATAPGLGCARPSFVEVAHADRELVVVLRPAPGVLLGTVVDGKGQPVADARVLVGVTMANSASGQHRRILGRIIGQDVWPSRFLRTDGEGRFRCEGLPPLPWPVWVGSSGFAPVRQLVEVLAIGETHTTIRLGCGATMSGRITDPGGQPVVGADISLWPLLPPSHAQIGLGMDVFNGPPLWANRRAATDAAGRYELCSVMAAKMRVSAWCGNGSTHAEITFAEGQVETWDAVITAPSVLHGLVVDSVGKPLGNWNVSIEGDKTSDGTVTDAQGAFRMGAVPEGTLRLRAQPYRPFVGVTIPVGEFRASDSPVRLVVPREQVPTGSLRGRLLAPDGSPCAKCTVRARHRGLQVETWRSTDDEGRFELAGLTDGTYMLAAETSSNRFGELVLGPFDVVDSKVTDIGEFRFLQPGTFAVELVDAAGRRLPDAWVTLHELGTDSPRSSGLEHQEGRARGNLPPGRWLVAMRQPGTLAAQEVDIRSGETTELRFVVPDGLPFLLRVPAAARERGELRQLWRDANGRLLRDCRIDSDAPGKDVRLSAPSGRYTLEVRDQEGRAASTTFDLRPSIEPQIVELPLPAR